MEQVWMKRVKVLCGECECWDTEGQAIDYGRCCRNTPTIVGDYDEGSWPLVHATDFCFEGIQREKELLTEDD